MKKQLSAIICILTITLASCGGGNGKKSDTNPAPGEPTAATADSKKNHLSMKVNGQLWEADSDIFGAFHPQGYNKAILISGTKGPKGKSEQPFNINLYNTTGPGTYTVTKGNPDLNVAQLANMSAEHYLYGGALGATMKVVVTKASGNPTVVEATFEGELNGNSGDKIVITEGKFSYYE